MGVGSSYIISTVGSSYIISTAHLALLKRFARHGNPTQKPRYRQWRGGRNAHAFSYEIISDQTDANNKKLQLNFTLKQAGVTTLYKGYNS